MKLDQAQFDSLLAAIQSDAPTFTFGNLISIVAAAVAITSLATSYLLVRQHRSIERRRYLAQLHETWWSDDLDTKRHIVWRELETWRKIGANSPAIRHYANKQEDTWPMESPERKAHARVLFFFSDLNRLIEHRLIDEDMAFEMFGIAQYEWFREYIQAIRKAVVARESDREKWPRWIIETEQFEGRLDAWKKRREKELR